jgi:SSS family solute:Na+ symporter
MWSVATALAFASAVHVSTGIPMIWSLVLTAVLLLAYLQGGGMWSIGLTQSINCLIFIIMLAIGVYALFASPGIGGLSELAETHPEFYAADTVGMTQIVAWFGTFIINVPLAQAAFQMAVSCRTPAEARKGLFWACLMGVPFVILATLLGLAGASVVPGAGKGLIAIPQYLETVLPAPLVGMFFLGIWACALAWGGPCQFSGATSLGRDVMTAVRPQSSEADLVRYTRWSLVIFDRANGDLRAAALGTISVVEYPGVDGAELGDIRACRRRTAVARRDPSGGARLDAHRLRDRPDVVPVQRLGYLAVPLRHPSGLARDER